MKAIALLTILFSLHSFAVLHPAKMGELIDECTDINGKNVEFVFGRDDSMNGYATIVVGKDHQYTPIVQIDASFFYSQPDISEAFIIENLCAHHALGHVLSRKAIISKDVLDADCFAIKGLVKKGMISGQGQINEIATSLYRMTYDRKDVKSSAGYPGLMERLDNIQACAVPNVKSVK